MQPSVFLTHPKTRNNSPKKTKTMTDKITLTKRENEEFEALEEIIEDGLNAFGQAGQALIQIRDKKLYRATHGTFEVYVREKWDLARNRAYRLMEAAIVVQNVAHGQQTGPTSERQARPLTKLDTPEQQVAAWELAGDIAAEENKPVTAKHVERAAEAVSAAVNDQPDEDITPPPPKTKDAIKAKAKDKIKAAPEPQQEDFGGPDLAQELEDTHKDNLKLQELVTSLSATDSAKEIIVWRGKYEAINGRVNQMLETERQMKSQLTYQTKLLSDIRRRLGVEKNTQILEVLP